MRMQTGPYMSMQQLNHGRGQATAGAGDARCCQDRALPSLIAGQIQGQVQPGCSADHDQFGTILKQGGKCWRIPYALKMVWKSLFHRITQPRITTCDAGPKL